MDILEFIEKIINGVGGLHDFERYEMASPKYDRDVSVAIWVIKCLANPKCEGSEEAIQAIVERRKKIATQPRVHLTSGGRGAKRTVNLHPPPLPSNASR